MSYEVTAIRKRPHTFESLVGQEFVVSTLSNSLTSQNFAHAYLFSGPHGVGKTSVARILAASLNCESGPTPQPCCHCASCKEIIAGNSLDVIEIDGASNTSVEDVRAIKDAILFPPNSSRFKIYIIDEVHMLSNSAFNALLKTIEEPPAHVIFIFATTEIHKVLPTIRSRCQQFNFRLIDTDVIKNLLKERCVEKNLQFEEDALLWIAKEAAGSMRDAYMLFDQIVTFSDGSISLQKIRENLGVIGFDRINDLVCLMAEGKEHQVLETTAEILSAGVSVEQLITDLSEYFRGLLLLKHGVEKESLIGVRKDRFHLINLEAFSVAGIESALSALFQLYRDIRFSINPRFELELVLSRLSQLKNFLTKSQLLEELFILKQQLFKQVPLQNLSMTLPEPEKNLNPPPKTPHFVDPLSAPLQETFPPTNSAFNPTLQRQPLQEPVSQETPLLEKEVLPLLKQIASENRKTFLEKAISEIKKVIIEGNSISLYCKDDYDKNMITQSRDILQNSLQKTTGILYHLSTSVYNDASKKQEEEDSEEVDIFKKVFNAEIITKENKSSFPEPPNEDLNF